jgi:hypothetical protein
MVQLILAEALTFLRSLWYSDVWPQCRDISSGFSVAEIRFQGNLMKKIPQPGVTPEGDGQNELAAAWYRRFYRNCDVLLSAD